MTIRSIFLKARLPLAVCLGASLAAAATCASPPALEAKLHANPDVQTYIDLGTWFGDHRNYDCAVETFRAALKLEPGSAQLS